MKSAIVWGLGEKYKEYSKEIRKKYDVKFLVDSNVDLWYKEIDGLEVKPPYEITKYAVDKYIITVTNTRSFNEISNYLRRFNIDVNKIDFSYTGKVVTIKTKDIFIHAHDFKNGLCEEGFLLYQIIINYLTIERCYNNYNDMNNNEIFMLHHTFMHFRDSKIVLEKKDGTQALIKDYDKNGVNGMAGYPITLDRTGKMIDGHHRVALYLYHHIPYMKAVVCDEIKSPLCFDINFLKNSRLAITEKEYNNILECYRKILNEVK